MDWIAPSFFRIRAAPAAAAKLVRLPPDVQDRLRMILEEITELASISPPRPDNSWLSGALPLLTLQLGRVCVRYSISDESRTLSIEHVIFLDDEEPLGQTG